VLYCTTVSTTVLCTCVHQARRQLKQVPLAFVLMTSRRRVNYVRVLQALLDALPQPPAVQTIVSDFKAALWSAARDVFPGIAQRGCEFHFSQAVWRNVQSVSLQSAYAKDDVINRVCRKTHALCFLPADVIGDEFGKLKQVKAAGGDSTLVCRSICSTSALTGLTAVGDRQRGPYFAIRSAPTTMLKAGITV